MLHLKAVIPGEYWDSHVYAGRLLLFTRQGSLRTLDWDKAVRKVSVPPRLRLGLVTAFLRSDFLYHPDLRALFADPDIKQILETKFADLAANDVVFQTEDLDALLQSEQDNRFTFPHNDSLIYNYKLIVGSSTGIQQATFRKNETPNVSSRLIKRSDLPNFHLSASYGSIAFAAGDEGLFEIPATQYSWDEGERRASEESCQSCDFVYQSIFGVSRTLGGFLVEYEQFTTSPEETAPRRPIGFSPAEELFGTRGFSWGLKDKICQATNGSIAVRRFDPYHEQRFHGLGTLRSVRSSEEIVSASSAPFGYVVEYSDCLVVYPSVGHPILLPGEPVNWRVFPRAKYYQNQLHVIYEDRLEILSFNHDYFVDQALKTAGIRATLQSSRGADALRDFLSA